MVAGIVAGSAVQVVREQFANEVAPVWVATLRMQCRFQIKAGRINARLGSRVTNVTCTDQIGEKKIRKGSES